MISKLLNIPLIKRILLLVVIGFSFFQIHAQSVSEYLNRAHNQDYNKKSVVGLDSVLNSKFISEDTSYITRMNVLILKGMVEKIKGNQPRALELLLSAVKGLDTSNHNVIKAIAFHRTAGVFLRLDEYESSAIYYKKAIALAEQYDSINYPKYLGDYAITFAQQGETDSAAFFWNKVINYYGSNKPAYYYNTLGNLAILKEWEEEYELAREWYREVINFYLTEHNYQKVTTHYINLGGNFADAKMPDSAKHYFVIAKEMADSGKNVNLALSVAINLSRLNEDTKNFEEALKWEKVRYKLNDSLKSTEALVQIGTIEEKYKNKIEEDRAFRRAEELKAKAERQANIQFFGIFLGIIFLFILVFALGFVKITIPLWLANSIVFFAFVLLFEFLLVVLDPTIDNWSDGKPIIKLACNVALAVLIIPLHTLFEGRLRQFLVRVKGS